MQIGKQWLEIICPTTEDPRQWQNRVTNKYARTYSPLGKGHNISTYEIKIAYD